MANPTVPFGYRAVSRMGGLPFSARTYAKPATDTYAIFAGDVVYKVAGAVANPENATYNYDTVQSSYETGTPGTTLIQGVAACYGAASTLSIQPVYDEIDCIFLGMGKTGTTFSTVNNSGENANNDTTTAGSTTTKQSGNQLASFATTNTLDFKTLKIATIVPNAEGVNCLWEVLINKHQFGQSALGVA